LKKNSGKKLRPPARKKALNKKGRNLEQNGRCPDPQQERKKGLHPLWRADIHQRGPEASLGEGRWGQGVEGCKYERKVGQYIAESNWNTGIKAFLLTRGATRLKSIGKKKRN